MPMRKPRYDVWKPKMASHHSPRGCFCDWSSFDITILCSEQVMNGNFLQEESLEREMDHNNARSLSSCELELYVKLCFRDTRRHHDCVQTAPCSKALWVPTGLCCFFLTVVELLCFAAWEAASLFPKPAYPVPPPLPSICIDINYQALKDLYRKSSTVTFQQIFLKYNLISLLQCLILTVC